MKMNLQSEERRVSQVTTSPFRQGEMLICHSQMRHANFPLERHHTLGVLTQPCQSGLEH